MVVSSISVASRAHRALRGIYGYTPIGELVFSDVDGLLREKVEPGESPIGLYQSSIGGLVQILITDLGLLVLEGGVVTRVNYHDISEVLSLDSKSVRYVDVCLREGSEVRLPVRGGEGRLRDSFAFYTFLRHVVVDISSGWRQIRP